MDPELDLNNADSVADAIAGTADVNLSPEATPVPGDGNEATPPSTEQPGAQDDSTSTEVTDDDLLGDFDDQLGTTSENTAEQQAERYAASSKEARRLTSNHDALAADLEKQGVKILLNDNGEYEGVLAVASSADAEAPPPPNVEGELGDLLVTDAEAAVEKIWAIAEKKFAAHFARATGTVESVSRPPSVETVELATRSMADAKDKLGQPRFPGVEQNKSVVETMVSRLPAELREAYNEHPQLVLGLLHDRAAYSRLQLLEGGKAAAAQAANKAKGAEQSASVAPSGDTTILIGDGAASAAGQMAEMIAKS